MASLSHRLKLLAVYRLPHPLPEACRSLPGSGTKIVHSASNIWIVYELAVVLLDGSGVGLLHLFKISSCNPLHSLPHQSLAVTWSVSP